MVIKDANSAEVKKNSNPRTEDVAAQPDVIRSVLG